MAGALYVSPESACHAHANWHLYLPISKEKGKQFMNISEDVGVILRREPDQCVKVIENKIRTINDFTWCVLLDSLPWCKIKPLNITNV